MIIGDKIKEIVSINKELVDKYLATNILGSMLNCQEFIVDEFGDDDISTKFNELRDLVMSKGKEIWETKIEQ